MNNITTNVQESNIATKNQHNEWVLEKVLSFLQSIIIEFMSRITSIDINRSEMNTSVHLSFSNDYSQE